MHPAAARSLQPTGLWRRADSRSSPRSPEHRARPRKDRPRETFNLLCLIATNLHSRIEQLTCWNGILACFVLLKLVHRFKPHSDLHNLLRKLQYIESFLTHCIKCKQISLQPNSAFYAVRLNWPFLPKRCHSSNINNISFMIENKNKGCHF